MTNANPFAAATKHGINPKLVEADGIEPTTPCVQGRCSPG